MVGHADAGGVKPFRWGGLDAVGEVFEDRGRGPHCRADPRWQVGDLLFGLGQVGADFGDEGVGGVVASSAVGVAAAEG